MVGRKKGSGHDHEHPHEHSHSHGVRREDTDGARTMAKLARISQKKQTEDIRRSLEFGLEAADSVDRSQYLSVQPRTSAGLCRHQYLHEGALLRGHPQDR